MSELRLTRHYDVCTMESRGRDRSWHLCLYQFAVGRFHAVNVLWDAKGYHISLHQTTDETFKQCETFSDTVISRRICKGI
jgi:hypothetical protein